MFNVLILAGASKRGELEELEGVNNKSFIIINGRPMLKIILDTLNKVEKIGEVVIIGPVDDLKKFQNEMSNIKLVPQQDSMLGNLAAGLSVLEPHEPCIVMSADTPLLTVDAINDFFELCRPHDMDLYYPIIHKKVCEERFPEVKRTYMHTKEGTFTGGNMMMLKPYWIIEQIDRLNVYFSYRKKPWKLVQTLSFKLIIKYILRTLSLKEVSEYLSNLFNIKAITVISSFPEIGVDVDKPDDIILVRKQLS